MFARVATIEEAPPERLDEMTHAFKEHVLPGLRKQAGFAGALVLVERGSGNKVLMVTLWESQQAMSASEEAAYWFRAFSAEAASGMVKGVERYEVFFSEVKGS